VVKIFSDLIRTRSVLIVQCLHYVQISPPVSNHGGLKTQPLWREYQTIEPRVCYGRRFSCVGR